MIGRLLQVRHGEGPRVVLLFTYLFLVIASYIVTRNTRDAIFMERFPVVRLTYVDMASAVLAGLRGADGRLARSWKDGRRTGIGILEDHACLAEGLLALYEATFDERWFTEAHRLAHELLLDLDLERMADARHADEAPLDAGETIVLPERAPEPQARPSAAAPRLASPSRFEAPPDAAEARNVTLSIGAIELTVEEPPPASAVAPPPAPSPVESEGAAVRLRRHYYNGWGGL